MYNPLTPQLFVTTSNPNGALAGSAAGARNNGSAPDIVWDGQDFWVCTTTGTTTTAVWSPLSTTNLKTVVNNLGTIATGTVTLNRTSGPVQQLTVGGALTIALTGWLANSWSEIILELTNGGSQTLIWPTINWITATGVTTTSFTTYGITLQTAGTDFVYFFSPDGGTTIFGKVLRG